MITFGYKGKFTGPLRALTAIAIGVVMVWSKANALNIAVQIIAAFLVASGLVSLVVGYKNRADGAFALMGFNTVVDIFLGILLFLFPGFFAGLLVYLIAFVLIGFGLFQIVALGSASGVFRMGAIAFILPVVVIILGMFLIVRPSFIGETIGVIAGVALMIYGISELLSSWKMKKAIDEYEIKYPTRKPEPEAEEEIQVKDVEYEKVDEQ
ncbi:MAG: DUF308 domain-containing protein [Bacteroidales bacterium]|nr:DUF308 domain-containing protein [Bacteroidales bacterium]MBR2856551.1 DUF308 domain-containing protein [Bacteroidales bacterium]